MILTETQFKSVINRLIKEAHKNSNIDNMVNTLINDNELKVSYKEADEATIRKELITAINLKISEITESTFENKNCYILPLGNFVIKNDKEKKEFGLIENEEDVFQFNSCYTIVYRDSIVDFGLVNMFKADYKKIADDYLKSINKKSATEQDIIDFENDKNNKNPKRKLKKEVGEPVLVFVEDYLKKPIIVDITKYEEQPQEKISRRLEPGEYNVGDKLTHSLFGKGKILKVDPYTKKDGTETVMLTIKFFDKERKVLI